LGNTYPNANADPYTNEYRYSDRDRDRYSDRDADRYVNADTYTRRSTGTLPICSSVGASGLCARLRY
jgi:hypothetical protein